MSKITKEKFLIELGKLLAFMSDDDRDTAVAMYGKMFELSPNEEALSAYLVSPTRQAVQLARVYNANDKKLSFYTNADDTEDEEESFDESPAYIERIKEIFSDALDAIPVQDANDKAEKQLKDATQSLEHIAGEKGILNPANEDYVRIYDSKEETDKVDSFMSEFSIAEPAIASSVIVEEKTIPTETIAEDKPIEDGTETSTKISEEEKPVENMPENTKLSGSALAMFLLIAIPLTALALIIEFIVALGFVALAAAAGLMCFRIVQAAFGSFRVFADVLVVTGTGFVLGALAILFLWTAIFLIVGVTKHLVNGIVNLAIKICSKEVSDNNG